MTMPNPVVEAARRKAEQLKKEAEERKKYGNFDYLVLDPGPNQIRILPPPPGEVEFWKEYKASFNVGPNKRTVIPARQFDPNAEDPLMDHLNELYESRTKDGKILADRMWPKTRYSMWAVKRTDDEQKPKLFSTSVTVFLQISGIFSDPDYDDITDPQNGTDIVITFTPNKDDPRKNEYQVLPKRKPSPLGTPEQITEWTKENLFKRHGIGEPFDADYVRKILAGKDRDDAKPRTNEQRKADDEAFLGKSAPKQEDSNPLTDTYWIVHPVTNTVMEVPDTFVAEFIKQGHTNLQLMKTGEEETGEWHPADFYGFEPPRKAPPPPTPKPEAPKSPPTAPPKLPPAPEPEVESEDDAELKEQLQALRARKAGQNTAAADLTKALEE
jgi:hypothetical protein